MMNLKERLEALFPYDEFLVMDGYDDCVAGVAYVMSRGRVLVYDRFKVLQKLIGQGMTYDDAVDFHEVNQAGSYLGDKTPLFLDRIEVEGI